MFPWGMQKRHFSGGMETSGVLGRMGLCHSYMLVWIMKIKGRVCAGSPRDKGLLAASFDDCIRLITPLNCLKNQQSYPFFWYCIL